MYTFVPIGCQDIASATAKEKENCDGRKPFEIQCSRQDRTGENSRNFRRKIGGK